MEPLTLLATGATIILSGALTRVGELSLDGSIEQLRKLIVAKSPDTLAKLQAANQNPALLPETIESVATLLEDPERCISVLSVALFFFIPQPLLLEREKGSQSPSPKEGEGFKVRVKV